jgi:hypothetical protein
VDPVPGPLLLRKSGRAGIRTRDLWIITLINSFRASQEIHCVSIMNQLVAVYELSVLRVWPDICR